MLTVWQVLSYLGPAFGVDHNIRCIRKLLEAWPAWFFDLNADVGFR